jgi:hypothetical protein
MMGIHSCRGAGQGVWQPGRGGGGYGTGTCDNLLIHIRYAK